MPVLRFSIRWKVLILVAGVLTAAMVSYLALAIGLVRRDKVAYIYDLNASLARTLSAEVEAALETVSDKALFFSHQLGSGPSAADAEFVAHFFSGETSLLHIEVWQKQSDATFRLARQWLDHDRLARHNLTEAILERSRKEVPIPWQTVMASKRLVQNASVQPDAALLSLAVSTDDGKTIVVCTLEPDRLLRIFGHTDAYAAMLVDSRGTVIVHPDPHAVLTRQNMIDQPLVAEALSGRPVQGVRSKDSQGRGAFIGAFSRLADFGVAVITETPTSEALRTTRELVRTAILLAIAIFFCAVLATVFFSRRLAAPLRALHQATEAIGRGDFSVKIERRSQDEVGDLASAFSRMAKELAHRDRSLQETHAQLIQSEKLAVLGAMSAELSHEIRNPMASILGFTQLAGELTSLDEAKQSLATIGNQARRAKEILDNVLKYTRQDQLPEQQTLQVNVLIEESLRLISRQLAANQIELRTELEAHLPPVVGNAGQLQQVLLNLALNAQQAMENGGSLSIRSRAENGSVLVEVKDNGPGMPEEVKAKLFRPFFTTKPVGKGTGLGLSVSLNIMQQHRGQLIVDSEVGRGTTVRMELPRA